MNAAASEAPADPLDEVVADYLRSHAMGQGPARQAWLDRHPELADALATFFSDLDHVQSLTAPLRNALDPGPCWQGQHIGPYLVLDEIGVGGMGVVYRAQHGQIQRQAALKMLRAGPWASRAERERFHSEIHAVVALDHPHIVPIYDVGEHDGIPYFSMKLIEGGNLARWIAEAHGESNPSAKDSAGWFAGAADILAQVGRAVHHAHQRGILHRDLKPSNILLDWRDVESRRDLSAAIPYVADFGLAKQLPGAQQGPEWGRP